MYCGRRFKVQAPLLMSRVATTSWGSLPPLTPAGILQDRSMHPRTAAALGSLSLSSMQATRQVTSMPCAAQSAPTQVVA